MNLIRKFAVAIVLATRPHATREQQSPEGFAAFHKADIDKWWPIIKASGFKAE